MTLLLMSWGEENFTSTKQCVHLQEFTSREINDGASLSKHCTTLSSNNVHNKQPRASHKHRPTEERPSDNSCGSSRSSRAAVTAGTAVIAVCSEHAPKQLVARLILSYGRWKLSILFRNILSIPSNLYLRYNAEIITSEFFFYEVIRRLFDVTSLGFFSTYKLQLSTFTFNVIFRTWHHRRKKATRWKITQERK